MNGNAPGKTFHRLSFFLALIPLVLAAYLLTRSGVPLGCLEWIVPAPGFVLFLNCLAMPGSILSRDDDHRARQLAAVGQELHKRHAELNALRKILELAEDTPADRLLTPPDEP
ncbi:MAG: hypothetical protein EG826_07300 [Deltaproteobacteria bacterium]|nr:hypothetical protein [Deltaproteobacteria bacterium]